MFRLALGLIVLAQDLAHDLRFVLLELIADFGLRVGGGGNQGGVELSKLRVKVVEGAFDALLGFFEGRQQRRRDEALADGGADLFLVAQDVLITEAEAIEDGFGFGVNDGEKRAGQHHRHAAQEFAIEDFALGEIGELAGAAIKGDGGEEPVLPNGAEQGVGGKLRALLGEFRRGPGLFAVGIGLAVELELLALIAVQAKKEGSLLGVEEDLGVVAVAFQGFATFDQSLTEGGDGLGGFRKEISSRGAEGGMQWVGKEQPQRREQFLEEAKEGCAKGFTVAVVTVGEGLDFRAEERRFGETGEFVEAGGTSVRGGLRGDASVPEVGSADFFNVVVFGGKPKDRNSGLALGGEPLGERDGAQGFVKRIDGAPVEAYLLAGEDGGSAGLGEEGEVFGGWIDFGERGGDLGSPGVGILNGLAGAGEGIRRGGVVLEVGGDFGEVVEEVLEETTRPGEFAVAYTHAMCFGAGHALVETLRRLQTYLSR